MARLPWFKCYPSKLLGALGAMRPAEGYLYVVILLRIYESGGPIRDTVRILSRRTGLTERVVEGALSSLCAMDKIQIGSEGSIDSLTTHQGLADQLSVKKAGEIGGNASVGKRWKNIEEKQQKFSTVVERSCNGRSTIIDRDRDKKDSNLTVACPKPVRTRNVYPSEFEVFWKEYPTDSLMSKKAALESWRRLADDDREALMMSLSAFRAYCESNVDYRPVHACRYISQRRFDGFFETAAKAKSMFLVKRGSKQWGAWDAWWRAVNRQGMPVSEKVGGWFCPSEWPPAHEELAR